jgi:hypothetical protein
VAGKFVNVAEQTSTDMRRLFTRLRKASPEVAKETRVRFKKAAEPTLAKVKARQPEDTGELKRKTRIYVARGMVTIRSRAPYARPSEFGGRVQLWGRDKWVNYKASPAVLPATAEDRQRFVNEANAAVIDAYRKVGFR